MPTPNILLKSERDRRGWSQKETAEKIHAGEASYYRWESLGVTPTHYYRRALARLFGKSIEELGLLPPSRMPSSVILLKDADLDGEEIGQTVTTNIFLQLCTIMNESLHECRCEKYASIIEEFESMNRHNEFVAAMTRREAVQALALLPFSPPLCLAQGNVLSTSQYDLFLQEIGAALVACEDLAKSIDYRDISLVFRVCSRYLVELKAIIRSSSHYREQAQELACRYAILKTNVGWGCVGDAATLLLAKEAVELAQNFGHVELHLSALSKLAWAYLYQDEEALALSMAEEAVALLQRYKGPVSACIYGGTWSTFSVMQSHNFLDPDLALKMVGERGSPEDISLYGMKFDGSRVLLERGIAQCGYGQTSEAMASYAQIIDLESLKVFPAFQGIITEGRRLETILYMAEASLTGDARDMGEAIRYWEYACRFGKKSKHSKSKVTAIYRAMRLAFPGEKQVSRLSGMLKDEQKSGG